MSENNYHEEDGYEEDGYKEDGYEDGYEEDGYEDFLKIEDKFKIVLDNTLDILSDQQSYIANLDDKISEIMCYYVYNWSSVLLNENLRKQQTVKFTEIQRMKSVLKNIFKNVPPIKEEIIVYRGVKNINPKNYGSEFMPGSYVSASLFPVHPFENFTEDIFYSIKVLPGSKVLPLYLFCPYDKSTITYEVLLDKNFLVNCSIENIDDKLSNLTYNNELEQIFYNIYSESFRKKNLIISNCVYGPVSLDIYDYKLPGNSLVSFENKKQINDIDNFNNITLTKKKKRSKKKYIKKINKNRTRSR